MIPKLDDTHDVNFNAQDIKRCLRVMSSTINQLIDEVEFLSQSPSEEEFDDEEDETEYVDIDPSDLITKKGKR